MALEKVQIQGWLKSVHENFVQLEDFVSDAPGLGVLRVARWEFDVDGVDSDGDGNEEIGAHKVGVTIPAHSIVCGGFNDVNTPFTSEGGNNATVAVHIQTANDIQTAAAVDGAPWSTHGLKAIVPKANTPESTGIKLTEDREVTVTVATSELLSGKITGYLYFLPGVASAALPSSPAS